MPSTAFITARHGKPVRLLATALGTALVSTAPAAFAAPDNGDNAKPDADAASSTPEADAGNTTELEGITVQSSAVKQASSPKFTAPLLDTPRQVSVVPAQLINEMGATTLTEALRAVPGITFGAGEGGNPQGDRPFLRGYDAQNSTFVDGVRDPGAQSRETFAVDRIEVIKGPDSVYSGRSNGGGSINLVSKLPVAQDFTEVTLGAGTADYKRATIDANYRVGEDSAFRVALMGHDAGVAGRDEVSSRRFGFAPSFTLGLDSPTTATFSFYHLNTDDMPDPGIPYLYGSTNLPAGVRVVRPVDGGDRNNFYGLVDRDFRKTQADIGTVKLQHAFNDDWTLRNTTRYGRTRQDYILSQPDDSQGNVANGMVWRRMNTRAGNTVAAINQTDLAGKFSTGSIRHDIDVGVELSKEKSARDTYVVPNIAAAVACGQLGVGSPSYYNCTSLYDPDPNDPWVPGTWANGVFTPTPITRANKPIRTTANTQALYAMDTIHFTEQWLANVGVRYDDFSTKAPITYCPTLPGSVCPRGTTGITEEHRSSSGNWTWQAGLVWKPVEQGSFYVSYATAVTPPGSFVGEGSDTNPISIADLDPEKSRNLEAGVKWELLDRRVSVSADVFQNEKTNARQLQADGSYANIGETRVRGVEFSIDGKITETWSVFAGYARMDSELVKGGFTSGAPNPLTGTRLANTPKDSLSLWTTWQATPAITIGGGAFAVSDVAGSFVVNAADKQITEKGVPGYVRFDAMASWQINERLALRLNVQNLTDKTYYAQAYPTHFATEAPGRQAIVSASYRF